MCLAPRYRSGPMAAPRIDCRNTASLPDTPCALASGTNTTASNAMVRNAIRLGATLIFLVTGIARFIERLAGFHDLVGTSRLHGSQDDLPRLNHRVRHLDPVASIDRAAIHQDQVAGFDQGRSVVADRLPLGVRVRRSLLGAFGRYDGP